MKKIILLVVLVMSFNLLLGCSSQSNVDNNVPKVNEISKDDPQDAPKDDGIMDIDIAKPVTSDQVQIQASEKGISVQTLGVDPFIVWSLNGPKNILKAQLDITPPEKDIVGQMYWVTSSDPKWDEAKSYRVDLTKGKSLYDIYVPEVTQATDIRFDFGQEKGIKLNVNHLKVWYKNI